MAAFFDVDRSTISKWESDSPDKGPALVLIRQLQERVAREPQRPAALDDHNGAASQAADGAGLPPSGLGRPAQQFHQEAAE